MIRSNLISKYELYKNIFISEQNLILNLFEALFYSQGGFQLECSHKILNNITYSQRLNLWYDKHEGIKDALNFFWNVGKLRGVSINYDIFDKMYSILNKKNRILNTVCGIDLRETLSASRIKLYFAVRNYPKIIRECIKIINFSEQGLKIIYDGDFLFGIDFFLTGQTRLKAYLAYNKKEINNNLNDFKKRFCRKTLALIENSESINISFRNRELEKTIHFKLKNRQEFLKLINVPAIIKINNVYEKIKVPLKIISLSEKELKVNKLREINLYY